MRVAVEVSGRFGSMCLVWRCGRFMRVFLVEIGDTSVAKDICSAKKVGANQIYTYANPRLRNTPAIDAVLRNHEGTVTLTLRIEMQMVARD